MAVVKASEATINNLKEALQNSDLKSNTLRLYVKAG